MDQKSAQFIQKAKKTHNNYCDYTKTRYVNARTKITIICPKHGEFQQLPRKHIKTKAGGCPKCSREHSNDYRLISIEEFLTRAQKLHNNKYNYSKTLLTKLSNKVTIICPKHGEFQQIASNHLSGHGCPSCNSRKTPNQTKSPYNTNWFIECAQSVHGELYDYKKTQYQQSQNKVTIICPKHGEFQQTARDHLNGSGCPKCGLITLSKNNRLSNAEFIDRCNKIHLGKYDYSKVNILNNKTRISIICPKHGEFQQTPKNHLRGQGCSKCHTSSIHMSIAAILDKLNIKYIINDRTTIGPLEIDIFVPQFNVGIEANGLYWHSYDSLESKDEIYRHYHKCDIAARNNIQLYQFNEDEIINKINIIESMVMHACCMSRKIYARDTKFKQIDTKTAKTFCEENHLCGYRGGGAYGLYHDGRLLSVVVIARHQDGYELMRACTKVGHCVVGGLSKLIANWARLHNPKFLMTYADRRHSDANSYRKAGFKDIGITKPGYKYCDCGGIKTYSRHKFQKHKLSKKLNCFDPALSEPENMFKNGYRRMWDAGNYKLVKVFDGKQKGVYDS